MDKKGLNLTDIKHCGATITANGTRVYLDVENGKMADFWQRCWTSEAQVLKSDWSVVLFEETGVRYSDPAFCGRVTRHTFTLCKNCAAKAGWLW